MNVHGKQLGTTIPPYFCSNVQQNVYKKNNLASQLQMNDNNSHILT